MRHSNGNGPPAESKRSLLAPEPRPLLSPPQNPNSFRKLVATFLEANGRGYWEADPEKIERLRQLYMDVEDKIEGVE